MATAFHPRDYLALFRRNRNMRLLWTAAVVSMTADWFHRIAIHTLLLTFFVEAGAAGVIASADVEPLVLLWTTFAFMAQMSPPFLFSPIIGVIIDRYSRRTIMIWADLVRAVLALGFLAFTDLSMIWLLFALEIPLAIGAGFFDNSKRSILPDVVETKDDLVAANGIIQSTWGITAAVGALLGGVVTAWLGPQLAFLLNSVTFLLSMFLVMGVRVVEPHLAIVAEDNEARRRAKAAPKDAPVAPPEKSGGFMEGLRYIFARRPLLALVTAKPGWSLTGGMILTLHTLMGAEVFYNWGYKAVGIGMLHGARGVGGIVGSFLAAYLYPHFRKRPLRVMAIIFAVYGVDYLLVARAEHILTAAALLVIGTTLSAQLWIMPAIILQQTLPSTIRGRIFSFDQGLSLITIGISGMLAYVLRAYLDIGPRQIAFVAGGGLIAVGACYGLAAMFMDIDIEALMREAEEREASEAARREEVRSLGGKVAAGVGATQIVAALAEGDDGDHGATAGRADGVDGDATRGRTSGGAELERGGEGSLVDDDNGRGPHELEPIAPYGESCEPELSAIDLDEDDKHPCEKA